MCPPQGNPLDGGGYAVVDARETVHCVRRPQASRLDVVFFVFGVVGAALLKARRIFGELASVRIVLHRDPIIPHRPVRVPPSFNAIDPGVRPRPTDPLPLPIHRGPPDGLHVQELLRGVAMCIADGEDAVSESEAPADSKPIAGRQKRARLDGVTCPMCETSEALYMRGERSATESHPYLCADKCKTMGARMVRLWRSCSKARQDDGPWYLCAQCGVVGYWGTDRPSKG